MINIHLKAIDFVNRIIKKKKEEKKYKKYSYL